MNANGPNRSTRPSTLGSLRRLIPDRPIDYAATLVLAERQAELLLRLHGSSTLPIPSEIITDLPHLRVVHHDSPITGISHYNGNDWIITLNNRDPRALRRVTLLHEYAHIIWHGHENTLFTRDEPHLAYLQAEQAADYFAWNALMPTPAISKAWASGIKHIGELAELFDVREYTVLARLIQLRLWLPAHHRRRAHWSQLLAPVINQLPPTRPFVDVQNPEIAA